MENQQEEMAQTGLLELAFGLGWATADIAHLPAVPGVLSQVLGVPAARMSVVHWNGSTLMEHAHPAPEKRNDNNNVMLLTEVEESLGTDYTLRLSIESTTDLSSSQTEALDKAMRLIHTALNCILIGQRDRDSLGAPFTQLSEREWQICQALEGPDDEKQIAGTLACSRHTMHGYVKTLYRKLRVQSRLQLLDQLKRSREEVRRRTLEGFSTNKQNDQ
jgi:DNA-binding CsgD family transcriptional regulator